MVSLTVRSLPPRERLGSSTDLSSVPWHPSAPQPRGQQAGGLAFRNLVLTLECSRAVAPWAPGPRKYGLSSNNQEDEHLALGRGTLGGHLAQGLRSDSSRARPRPLCFQTLRRRPSTGRAPSSQQSRETKCTYLFEPLLFTVA